MIKLTKDTIIENDGKRIKLPAGSTLRMMKETSDNSLELFKKRITDSLFNKGMIDEIIGLRGNKSIPIIKDIKSKCENTKCFIDNTEIISVNDEYYYPSRSGSYEDQVSTLYGKVLAQLFDERIVEDIAFSVGDENIEIAGNIIKQMLQNCKPSAVNQLEESKTISESTDFERALSKIKPVQK